ncbi:MAG: MBL fold metallo-hydrolase [Betaproteobacteria bacterium]|nr:MBL fold metallo-hydrolase [Betaproteobacteria bacterium]MDE2048346.1 MBL fold metallo-hydrolase [Betaproteobacteria bacterium]
MSNPLEHQLTYPLADRLPAEGEALDVAPGIRWVRMPLPFALDHINLWLLRDRFTADDGSVAEGWTIVDCGIGVERTRALWERVFAAHLDGLPVRRILVTHMHPDHVGCAAWLAERWNAPVWMTATDFVMASLLSRGGQGSGGDAAAAHFARHGLTDADSIAKIKARTGYFPSLVPAMPHSYVRLLDGQNVMIDGEPWRVIVGYGHAPEHASLYNAARKLLISGDMLLPRISTNVSVWDNEPEADPLPLYLDSLRKYEPLAADTLVLPSHGKPFTGMHARLAQQHAHHDERLATLLAACDKPLSAADAVAVLFRPGLDLHQLTFAIGESLAHLHCLWRRGALRRLHGDDGVFRFQAAS